MAINILKFIIKKDNKYVYQKHDEYITEFRKYISSRLHEENG